MDFLIPTAYASAGAADAQGGNMFMIIALLFFAVVFYFLTIRPQQKKEKEHGAMLDALQKGDEVLTAGGLLGQVVKVGENFVSLELAEEVVIQIQKRSVMTLLPKGTIKSL